MWARNVTLAQTSVLPIPWIEFSDWDLMQKAKFIFEIGKWNRLDLT